MSTRLLERELQGHANGFAKGSVGWESRWTNQKWLFYSVLAAAALFVHGYHPYSEDAAIYVPAIKKLVDPTLYPSGEEFFAAANNFSFFPRLVALTAQLFHLSVPVVLMVWYVVSLVFLFHAAWRIAMSCFSDRALAQRGATLICALLTIPVAGTALLFADPYLTSRSLSTPLLLLSIAYGLEKRWKIAALWLACGIAIHPLMGLYAASFLFILLAVQGRKISTAIVTLLCLSGAIAVAAIGRNEIEPAYRAAIFTRPYFFLHQWHWYELVGAIAPLIIFAKVAQAGDSRSSPQVVECATAVLLYSGLFIGLAAMIDTFPSLLSLARYQPLRNLHLVYALLFILPVNLMLHRLLEVQPKSNAMVIMTLCVLMYFVQRHTFPNSTHVEWPGIRAHNAWQQAFDWVRRNTPKDAVFALSPEYMEQDGEDHHGFRASAERNALADLKDGGVAALFPSIAGDWLAQMKIASTMQLNFGENMGPAFWSVRPAGVASQVDCPYNNGKVEVCRTGISDSELEALLVDRQVDKATASENVLSSHLSAVHVTP